jgi:peptidoglycan/xylan/chitin deacetylase (PgdA/CDA1 family)
VNRFVSLTFDDGLIAGARIAVDMLAKRGGHASFFVVTGWVRPATVEVRDRPNVDRDHGTWDDWRTIAAAGHEVGSHTRSHVRATHWRARLDPFRLPREVDDSFDDLARELGSKPVSLAMPYDVWTPRAGALARRRYQVVRVGEARPHFHRVPDIDWGRLRSWGPDATQPIDGVCEAIAAIADEHWLILQFHSLANEGFQPLAPEKFDRILSTIAAGDGLHLVTLRDMAGRFNRSAQ